MIDYKMKGHTTITATDYEDVIAQKPNIRTFFKAIGWDVSFLSGYLDEGCHSISIGFLDNNFLFIKNFPNKICKEPKN